MNPDLPTGTVTFLFSDIQDSTRLWEAHPRAMQPALAQHDSLLKQAISSHNGRLIKTTGDGAMAVFTTALDGLKAALAAQLQLEQSPQEVHIRCRMGLHIGEADLRDGDYYGPAVNRAARLMQAGHGGQLLLSQAAAQVVRDDLPAGASLLDLGEHSLKDLARPEHIFQLAAEGLQGQFPPLKTQSTKNHNLPVQLTSFIGREKETAEIRSLLDSARLVTLTGSGGTGKTRLSVELGSQELEHFPDGVWMLELETITDPEQILPGLARLLGLQETPFVPVDRLVTDNLREKHMLLILDNCEHLVAACARLADDLLHACPHLKLLTSSREALGIAGEQVYRIPSLEEQASTRLFAERAQAANARFTLTAANQAAVAQICSHLDGIPLAIELAAARTRMLSPAQIAAHLDDRFKLLTGGSRTALPRQQTLRALIDWGYDLLNRQECGLLRRLSVFAGGWTYQAAEFICPDVDVLSLLEQLVNKSLVVAEELKDGSMRFRLLETIRQYAREKLQENGEQESAHERHAAYFMQLAEEVEPLLYTQVTSDLIQNLEHELDNIQAALEWLKEHDIEASMGMLYSLQMLWIMNANQSRGIALSEMVIDQALSTSSEMSPHRKLMIAKAMTSLLAARMSLGDNRNVAEVAARCAEFAIAGGDYAVASRAMTYQCVGWLAVGDTEGIDEISSRAMEYARKSGERLSQGYSMSVRGEYLVVTGKEPELAQKLTGQGTEILLELGYKWYYALIMMGIGMASKYRGDFKTARANLQKILPLFQELGDSQPVAMIRSEFAHMDRYEGKLDQAEAQYRETLPMWQKLGQGAAVANQLEDLGFIAIERAGFERAARLLGAAEALRQRIGIEMSQFEKEEYQREVGKLKSGMSAESLSRIWNEGRELSMDEAVKVAVS